MIKKIHLRTILYLLSYSLLIVPLFGGYSLEHTIEKSEFTSFVGEFTSIWDTTQPGTSLDNEITIPTNPAYTYNYTVDWGDGSSDTGITTDITHTYATSGIYTVKISGDFPAIYFNNSGDREKIIEILEWGIIEWLTMENAFYGCRNLNFDAIDSPNLSQATSLKNMFRGCLSFNGIVNNWDIGTITDISGMFYDAEIFNRPLDNWNVINVTDMSETFRDAELFNEPLDNWNTATVTNMQGMFDDAERFNQNINNWDVSNVTDMSRMFLDASAYNNPLNNWNVSNVTNMSQMFDDANSFNQNINNWIVDNVTDMSGMFSCINFNQPLDNWNVSAVTDMSSMFSVNRNFSQPINNWDVSSVTNMDTMFFFTVFNLPLDQWDVSGVTSMNSMFNRALFNLPLNDWDVSSVTSMSRMFGGNTSFTTPFNQPLDQWNTSAVVNVSGMFGWSAFNQNINDWDVSSVTNMSTMFASNTIYDQPLDNWAISTVTNTQAMFSGATSFNQDITNWDTQNITNMNVMFSGAQMFNQNLASWNITSVTQMGNMLSNSGLSQENYDNILIGWASQAVQSNVSLGALNIRYCDGRIARQELIDNFNWTITGDIVNCTNVFCTEIISPLDGATGVPANSDIVWNAAPQATGYLVSLRRENGGATQVIYDNEDLGNVTRITFTNEFLDGDVVYITVVPYNAEGPAENCDEISFSVVSSWQNNPNAYRIQIDTRIDGFATTPLDQFEVETNNDFTYNINIDWGDGEYDNNVTSDIIHTYDVPGIYNVAIIGEFPNPYFGVFGDGEKVLSIDRWGTFEYLSMEKACNDCENMIYNATDIPNLSQVTSMNEMFDGAVLFDANINDWDVSNVTDMSGLFNRTTAFNQPLDNWVVDNVTNMSRMFSAATSFNQPLDAWNTSNVEFMSSMFRSATSFTQNINGWDVSSVTNMASMFEGARLYNSPMDSWDVSNVTNMAGMFKRALIFNQSLNAWDVSNVTNMAEMFNGFFLDMEFNASLNDWDVDNVTDMREMFAYCPQFDQPLNNWNVGNVTDMSEMFHEASVFNQDINSWNVTNVITMQSMFEDALAFNEPLNNWDVNSVVSMVSTFQNAQAFDQPLNAWNVSAVANMTSMFRRANAFNQPIDNWNVSSVTLMTSMFESASAFNQNLNPWDVAVVTNMDSMFKDAIVFDQSLDSWDTGEVQNMQEMFSGATAFNQNIDSWNVSFVTTMEEMFRNATSYNQAMDSWNVASVTTMEGMFQGATSFNEAISSWNVRGVNTMAYMFDGATSFNRLLNNWRVSGVQNMDYMFRNASSYNQEMNMWDIGSVSMQSMLENATAFDQFLGDWNISSVSNMLDMLDNTSLTRENYDSTLIAWSEQALTTGINLGAESLLYCDSIDERQSMIDTYGWIFTDDIRDCPIPVCTQLTSPENGDVDVPINTNLVWEPVLYATEYVLTITLQPSGTIINATVTTESYEFMANELVGSTSVTVLIEPRNDEGTATGCVAETFFLSTNPATVPDCTILVTPLAGTIDVTITTDVSWQAIADADGYFLTVGTSTGGNDILNNEDVGNVTTYDLTNDLPEDTEIFVTITPYNEEGNATGCAEESFTTELIPVVPSCTTISDPLNGATNVAIDTDLSWNSVDGATGYLVSVGITQGGIEIANSIDVGNVTIYDFPTDLIENRTFYVTIIPYNDVGDAVGCMEESFRTGESTLNDPPACTTLTIPLNGAVDIAIGSNLTWSSSFNADGYRLTVGTSSGATDIINNQDVGNVTTFDLLADLPEGTEIFVTIVPYNSFGDATGCSEESFTTETIATIPSCTTLSIPLDGATNVLIGTDLSWNSISDATGYRLIVGTSSGATDIINNQDVGNVTTFDLPADLPENTEIFVTIIPYNAVGDATGCSEESFTTETIATIPSCTTLSIPLDGAANVGIGTDLSWNSISDATGYRLIVGTSSGGSDIINNQDVGNVTTFDLPADLPENTEIFVTIIPYNAVGDATGCSEESFTTETVATIPSCTTLSIPLDGATDISIGTDLSWNAVSNATGYRLIVGTSSGGSDIINNQDVGNVTTFDLPAELPENTEIFVAIIPYNAVGDATGCSEERFTTETVATIPSCTTLSIPLDGATDISIGTDLSWNSISDATGYRLIVGTSSGGSDIINNQDVGNVTTFDLSTDLPENTEIFVAIIPYNAVGDATGCSEESFTTETLATIPSCTTLSNPLSGDTDVSVDTDISWNAVSDATGYRLTVGTSSGVTDIINNQDIGNVTTFDLPIDLPENTTIFVTITPYNILGDATGCSEENFITENPIIIVEDDTKYGFSPDGDGINEFWEIDGIENYPGNTVSIYNRWGDMVFEISGYNNTSRVFRGDANRLTNLGGGALPEGTYFFSINIPQSNSLKKLKGFLVLKR
ncbi:BspA family leucine-rich repeat surface protein [Aquimarina latercula]|uniref:BspA family leucine-rich repeat surface protein n=1 Tax=Aquimarina latercula TaxID=987 RepID=UPI00041BB9BC|nr:BspA family leucine-rich repeat surface protein [Aquimarina latercula]